MNEQVADKIRGVIFGQAIGDALGVGTEFMSKKRVRKFYPDGLSGYDQIIQDGHRRKWVQGDWTDDTEQMLCIMDSLLALGRLDAQDIARRIIAWAAAGGLGIGRTVLAVISAPQFLEDPQSAAEQVWLASGKNAAANGGIMRTSILGVWNFQDEQAVRRNTEIGCQITHYDPRCVGSCVCATSIIQQLLLGADDLPALVAITQDAGNLYDARIAEYIELARQPEISKLELDQYEKIGYTLKALGASIWALLHANNFREGLLAVIHEGGDADTNAAVAGAILGAKFGYGGIPEEWANGLLRKNELEARVNALLDLNCGQSADESPA